MDMNIVAAGTKASGIYERYCQPVCREFGINQMDFQVLMSVAGDPSCNTARDICRRNGIKSGIVSLTVEKLTQRGWLRKECDRLDRRVQRLLLTPEAASVAEAGKQVQVDFLKALLSDFDEDEQQLYALLTGKLLHTIDRLAENKKTAME